MSKQPMTKQIPNPKSKIPNGFTPAPPNLDWPTTAG